MKRSNVALRKAKSAYFKNLLNENKKLPREFEKDLPGKIRGGWPY